MRICFRLSLCVVLAAAALSGSDLPGHSTKRIVTVVRPDPHSGKLVRSVLVTTKSAGGHKVSIKPAETPVAVDESAANLDEAVRMIASQHSLSPQLLHSVIKVESGYNAMAVSSKGALGLMQLIPATARRFGVANVFNPVENIEGGAKYLRYLLDLYNGNYPLALAAYNAGEKAVAKYGGIPPYPETQDYVDRVSRQMQGGKQSGQGTPSAPKAQAAAGDVPVPAGPAHILEVREPDGTVRYVSQ
jgi:Transglycosylase SLT domain